jgi:hypothetical protein
MDIVNLIETNPITKFSGNYQSRLVGKLRDSFTETQQQVFLTNFYCYLNCNKKDFVVDLDGVWGWMGFYDKATAKRCLEKYFVADKDYEKPLIPKDERISTNGGQNRQIIKLTVPAFKRFCLKAGTAKADEIHEYYIKLEEVLQETICEEGVELQNQLKLTKESAEEEKQKTIRAVEKTIIDQFPKNTECVYFGTIDNTENGEKLLKFGQTNDLQSRVYNHRGKFANFVLMNAFKVQNKVEIENLIKQHPKVKKQLRQITVGESTYKEIIAYDTTFTTDKMTYYVKEIIKSKQYSVDNYNKLLKRNDVLETEVVALNDTTAEYRATNMSLAREIAELKDRVRDQQNQINELMTERDYQQPVSEETKRFDEFVRECCLVRPDVEESSVMMEGQFRIWNGAKPTKQFFHQFKQYLDTRFRPKRLDCQDKNQMVHGYAGVKLQALEYKRSRDITCDAETFVFGVCRFAPQGKMLNSELLANYKRWKKSMGRGVDPDMADDKPLMKELKEYLNASAYVQKATVWKNGTTNEGYYGLALREDDTYEHKLTSSTGKRVTKICMETNQALRTWETIAKAAADENMSAAKMSRSIKNKMIFNDDYFFCV